MRPLNQLCCSFTIQLRLEENAAAREALMVTQRQENEVTKKTLTEALDQIEGLVKEVECANHSVHQLQDSIQRYCGIVVIYGTCVS
jgi:myosin-5